MSRLYDPDHSWDEHEARDEVGGEFELAMQNNKLLSSLIDFMWLHTPTEDREGLESKIRESITRELFK